MKVEMAYTKHTYLSPPSRPREKLEWEKALESISQPARFIEYERLSGTELHATIVTYVCSRVEAGTANEKEKRMAERVKRARCELDILFALLSLLLPRPMVVIGPVLPVRRDIERRKNPAFRREEERREKERKRDGNGNGEKKEQTEREREETTERKCEELLNKFYCHILNIISLSIDFEPFLSSSDAFRSFRRPLIHFGCCQLLRMKYDPLYESGVRGWLEPFDSKTYIYEAVALVKKRIAERKNETRERKGEVVRELEREVVREREKGVKKDKERESEERKKTAERKVEIEKREREKEKKEEGGNTNDPFVPSLSLSPSTIPRAFTSYSLSSSTPHTLRNDSSLSTNKSFSRRVKAASFSINQPLSHIKMSSAAERERERKVERERKGEKSENRHRARTMNQISKTWERNRLPRERSETEVKVKFEKQD